MTTRREQILQAIVTKLGAVPGITAVHRSLADALAREDTMAVCVQWSADQLGGPSSLMFQDRRLEVQIGVYGRGAVPDQLVDPVCESVHALLMADTQLGGLAIDISEGDTTLDLEGADATAGWVTMRYSVLYRVTRTSLAA